MTLGFSFFFNSILLGVGLAMDAFSVSLANGLNEPTMKRGRMGGVAGVFSLFQFAMPMIGWICVSTIAQYFEAFEVCIPWIALILLVFIGVRMILEGRKKPEEEKESLHGWGLIVQGIATSIDALSVGFTIAHYSFPFALADALIIGVVTFGLCFAGYHFGRRIGSKISGKASVAGGIILILIGIVAVAVGFLTGADTARIYQTAEDNSMIRQVMAYYDWIVQVVQTYWNAFFGA